jgi:hypothetical protein
LRGERWRFVLKARRAPTLTTAAAAANQCGACSGERQSSEKLQGKNRDQSTPKSIGRRRRKAELLPFGAEDGPAPRYDNDNADGDVRSTSRKDARKHQSPDLNAAMPMSSAKPQRRRKPAGDLKSNKPRFVRARTTTSAAKQQRARRTLPAIACFYAPMFGVLRDPEKDGWQDGASADANLETTS